LSAYLQQGPAGDIAYNFRRACGFVWTVRQGAHAMDCACTHRLPLPQNPSCRCFSSMAPISSDGSWASAARRSPRGCRSRSGRTRRPGPTCRRRGSLIPRAKN